MKRSIFLNTIAFMCLFGGFASAARLKDSNCHDFVSVKDNFTPQYLAVVDGYESSKVEPKDNIDIGGLVTQVEQFKTECRVNGGESLREARDKIAHETTARRADKKQTSFLPKNAKCQEFTALGEEYRPVAAFWVAGHAKGKAGGSAHMDEEFLARPVTTLYQDCQAHPQASFYDRAQAWSNRKL